MSLNLNRPKVGDKVTVSFTGTVMGVPAPDSMVTVASDDSGMWHQVCYYDTGDVERIKPKPKSWPPQRGQVWRADGRNWLVYQITGAADKDIFLIRDGCTVLNAEEFLAKYPHPSLILSGGSAS